MVKNTPANAGEIRNAGLTPGLERSPGGGNSFPFQYSCLENSVNRKAWQATIHGIAELDTSEQLSLKIKPLGIFMNR